jgi:hypothetical protein
MLAAAVLLASLVSLSTANGNVQATTISKPASSSTTAPKTIVSIISDDHGYFDLSYRGNTNVTTPNLDQLFKSGIDLSHHYSFKYCSPSRRSFVTGRWAMHLGELNNNGYTGIDIRFSTLADKLKTVGWRSVLIGKTHWGTKAPVHLPINRGFDEHVGYLGGKPRTQPQQNRKLMHLCLLRWGGLQHRTRVCGRGHQLRHVQERTGLLAQPSARRGVAHRPVLHRFIH